MANVWREPIFDRTLADVEFAIQKIAEWKRGHTHTTDVRIENDALVVRGVRVAYTTEDVLVLQDEGAVYTEDGALIVKVGDVYELKGCLNLLDLNRIEGNIAYLADRMESYSYAPNIHYKHWDRENLPNLNDMTRIMENVQALISAFYSPDNPPPLTSMTHYDGINAIEENLYLLKQMLDCMESSFTKVGTIKSGSTMFLPIRR